MASSLFALPADAVPDDFALWLLARERAGLPLGVSSQSLYRAMWQRLLRFMAERNLCLQRLTGEHLALFLSQPNGRYGTMGRRMRRRYLQFISHMMNEQITRQIRHDNPAQQMLNSVHEQVTFPPPLALSHEQACQFAADSADLDEWTHCRDWAMRHLILGAGLKACEVPGLRIDDLYLDLSDPFVRIAERGRQPHRTSLLHRNSVAALRYWLTVRQSLATAGDLLFPSDETGKALSLSTIYRHTRDALSACGIQAGQMGNQLLRNTYITRELANGQTPATICRSLGLHRISSLERYQKLLEDTQDEKRPEWITQAFLVLPLFHNAKDTTDP